MKVLSAWGHAAARIAFSLLALVHAGAAFPQSTSAFFEQGELKRASRNITAIGSDLAGEKVDLFTGSTSINQTDIVLPGNNALRVAWGRAYELSKRTRFGPMPPEVPRIYGTFAMGALVTPTGWITSRPSTADKQKRCTYFSPPPFVMERNGSLSWDADQFWSGNRLYIPGEIDEVIQHPSPANSDLPTGTPYTYKLVTKSNWRLGCIPLTVGSGEGFVALSPTGTMYIFDRMTWRQAYGIGGSLARQEVMILASRVIDRFGNWVDFKYDPTYSTRVVAIEASDGRRLSMTYQTDDTYTVSDGTRTWAYAPNQLTQPDGSKWQWSVVAPAAPTYSPMASCGPQNNVWTEGTLVPTPAVSTFTHPSGATVKFTMAWVSHGNAGISTIPWNQCPYYGDFYEIPVTPTYAVRSIVQKEISGPGLPTMTWQYDWGPPNGSWYCPAGCPRTKNLVVTDPAGDKTRYTFGNSFQVDESVLYKVEEGWNADTGAALRTTDNTYRTTGGGYPLDVGSSGRAEGDGMEGKNWPLEQRVVTQQGVQFRWAASAFDEKVRPTVVTKSSGLGYSRTETTLFKDIKSKWVLGQVESVTVGSQVPVFNTYDPATAQLLSSSEFGLPPTTFSWHPEGMLKTRTDGAGHTTTFSNWYRGFPRYVGHADGTTETADVVDQGWITARTDENLITTHYGYDAMGRLSSITPPAPWNATTLVFERVGAIEYGLQIGHWRQTISTGNARRVKYFDGLWRPVLTQEYDAADEANTRTMVLRVFDSDGRTRFESYPNRTISGVTAQPYGTATSYDALGRTAQVLADSELGWLTTNYTYLAGMQTAVTNPRGFTTTTTYGAFDDPEKAFSTAIAAPEGVSVGIGRNTTWGDTVMIVRSGAGVSATRGYVYDPSRRLCKTIEPESGATLVDYDAAGNIAWRAVGTGLTSGSCDRASAPAARTISYGYDLRNRLTTTTYGDGSPSVTRSYTPDGLLAQVATSGGSNPITWSYSYNSLRVLTQETYGWGDPNSNWTFQWGVDANGHLSSLTDPWGTMTYAPNALGQPTQVSGYASGVSYHPNGSVAGYTLTNGVAHNTTLNMRGLPLRATYAGVAQDAYTYDANGNVTAITDELQGLNSRSMPWYDGLDRLRQANGPWGAGSFSYDALDNLISSTVGGRSLSHNIDATTNRLTSLTGSQNIGIGYDANGNVTSRGGQGFVFDIGNRMSSAPGKASYLYDGHGRRNLAWFPGGDYMHQAYTQDGKLRFAWRASEGGTRHVYLGDKLIAETVEGGVTTFSHTDALGSPVAKTNPSGGLVSRTRYEPYGATVAGSTNPTKIGFTGHVNDPDTGLVYMQQRYYDPIAGRFLSVDPVVTNPNNASGFGRFTYVENNPYRYVDPDGLKCTGAKAEEAACTVDTINGKSFDRSSLSAGDKALLAKIEGALTTAYKGALALGDGTLKVQQDSTGRNFADVSGKEISALLRDSTANLSSDTGTDGRWAQASFQNGDVRQPEITFFGGSIRGGEAHVRDSLRQAGAHEPLHLARELRLFPMPGNAHNQWFDPAVRELLRLGDGKR